MKNARFWFAFILCISFTTFSLLPAGAQSTIATGSIQGTVTDPNGAVVPGATITITNKATGQSSKFTSSGSGTYASGALIPGEYSVKIEAKGFQTQLLNVPVQVGNVAAGNAKLTLGQSTEVVEVTGSAVAVNTEQATVQGVLSTEQIENLPINGRNFLDLAQLEPGVQIQDGGNFDPTKNGFSSISFGGRFGRTARIEVDGIDISDETVGTTTQNLPASAIQEFQVSQSSLDLSTELTSSGAVNVVTRSGSNKWHGQAFYLFRDHSIGANIANTDVPFQRNNFGGQLGGPIFKDRLFFFVDAERLKQDLIETVASGGAFSSITGGFNSPFRDTNGVAKLDWKVSENVKVFGRFSYEQNSSTKGFIPNSFQPFTNVNHTPVYASGVDFNTGSFTHSVRFGFTKFRNAITDATKSGVFNPAPDLSITIGPSLTCLAGGVDQFCSGSNLLAPQQTYQQNTQIKYDGSKTIQKHILRYGFGYNHIQGGGFAKFFSLAPTVNVNGAVDCSATVTTDCIANIFPGGDANPLNYPADLVFMGNGQGFSSEKPAFGLPGGGLGPDNRIQFYGGDTWKIRPNLTLTYGVRYVRDTGRTDSDLGPIPCSQLDPALAAPLAAAGTPCNGNILDLWGLGLGNRVRVPGHNFGPTAGFVWDPTGSGKTVIRAGAGLYYENSIFNNNLFNRPGRLAQGLFLSEAAPCAGGGPTGFTLPSGSPIPAGIDPSVTPICGQPMGLVHSQLAQLQALYESDTQAVGAATNGAFIGNTLAAGFNINGINMFAPNYQTPRSVQMNIGFEHQLGKGVVWSGDYIRNVGTHTLLGIDVNHVGDVRFFNKTNAVAAINATIAGCGQATLAAAIGPGGCPSSAAPNAVGGASIADFAANGLDSGTSLCVGGPCPSAAFPGQNPNLGVNQMLFPAGRSLYNAFQTSLRANVRNPFAGVKALNWIVSYALSRTDGSALDLDFVNAAIDNNHSTAFFGPNGLDRTHQFSFGGTMDVPLGLRFGVVGHIYSPLPQTLLLPGGGNFGIGGIFQTDITGDGSGDGSAVYPNGDPLPGTSIGAFGRKIKNKDLNGFLANYNANVAGGVTPAGQTLINNGLFTAQQLQAIGAVLPQVALAPDGHVGLGWLKTFDLKLSYPRKFGENFAIEPSVSVFNAFNNANFDLPSTTIGPNLNLASAPCTPGAPAASNNCNGTVNSTTSVEHNLNRVLPGSGVFDLGAPRVIEFGLKLSF